MIMLDNKHVVETLRVFAKAVLGDEAPSNGELVERAFFAFELAYDSGRGAVALQVVQPIGDAR